MAAKRIDPFKAKQAKQKKIAIGGFVVLLAVLGFQGPKTLKMLKGPQPVASTAPATTAPAGVAPAPGAVAPGGIAAGAVPPLATAAAELSAVADSDASPEAEQGQLATFERFASKDPFAQQATAVAAPPAAAPADGTKAPPTDAKAGAEPSTGGSAGSGDGATDAGFTTGGSTDEPTEIAAATSIAVNGVAEDVAVDGAFPTEEPTFLLVKLAKNGKSVEIGIAGGEYASGGETITLGLGKKLTLQNTADGSRYELKLLAIQGYPVPKPKK